MKTFFGTTSCRQVAAGAVLAIFLICPSLAENPGVKDQGAPTKSLQATARAGPDIEIKDPKPYPFKFIAYGDMRFAENDKYLGKTIANSAARQSVISGIAGENPAFVAITGDFVFRGFHSEDWGYFDQAIKPLREAGVQMFPAIGNHEVWPPRSKGLTNYYAEFPNISHKPWYSVLYANCYVLVLDSETDDSPDSPQMKWMKKQLDSLPSAVDYVFITLHRPPYTAASEDGHRPRVQEQVLAKMLEDRQQRIRAHIIVIAGHVHNYERYRFGDVNYIVSGGGGAAQHKFDQRGPHDLYHPKDATEDEYHYCVFTVNHTKLSFQMMRLVSADAPARFEVGDSFELDDAPH